MTQNNRTVGRKATISKEEIVQATLVLISSGRSISSLSLREITRQAGIAPNSFYRHFQDIDRLAIELINLAGQVLRQIIREARLQASQNTSVIQSSVDVFLQQLDADSGYLSLLLRESHTGSASYKQAVEQQLVFFQQELQDDLSRLSESYGYRIIRPDVVAKAITQLVFNMGAKVQDLSACERQVVADETVLMIRMIVQGSRYLSVSERREINQQLQQKL